jgi:hypothetical protein
MGLEGESTALVTRNSKDIKQQIKSNFKITNIENMPVSDMHFL